LALIVGWWVFEVVLVIFELFFGLKVLVVEILFVDVIGIIFCAQRAGLGAGLGKAPASGCCGNKWGTHNSCGGLNHKAPVGM
jgi:hypothetical protein